MRLYFVRHGESKYNVLRLHQHGEVTLSKTGEKQARVVCEKKSAPHPDSDKNDPKRWHLLTWNDHTHVR